MFVLTKIECEINHAVKEISKIILDLKSWLDSSEVYPVIAYKSRNEEFGILPVLLETPLLTFTPREINREQLYKPKELTNTTDDYDNAIILLSANLLIDEPQVLSNINLKLGRWLRQLQGVGCINESEFWTLSGSKNLQLYNLQGELLKSVKTKSGYNSFDIAITQNRDLVYPDDYNKSINIMKKSQIEPLITFQASTPRDVCCSASGDLLVIIVYDSKKETKLVGYSGSTETQSIQ